jgi:hypothetical protein
MQLMHIPIIKVIIAVGAGVPGVHGLAERSEIAVHFTEFIDSTGAFQIQRDPTQVDRVGLCATCDGQVSHL